MEMYYVPWCPFCEVPQRKTVETLNLIQALHHIQAVTNDNGTEEKRFLDSYTRRMWALLIELEYIPSNDCFCQFHRPDIENYGDWSEQQRKDMSLFCDTFNITDKGVVLEISW